MAPIPVWSGNLRLSLVLVPVRMFPATSTEGTIAFRMVHEPSGKPIKYLKGIETDHGFEEQRAPEAAIAPESGEAPKVINIMDALKKSMQAKSQTKVKEAVRKRMGKAAPKRQATPVSPRSRSATSRTVH